MSERSRGGSGSVQRALSRRRLLAGAGLSAAGLAAGSVACSTKGKQAASAGKPAASNQAAEQPKRGGSLNYAGGAAGSYDTQGRSFDPMIQTQFGAKTYTLFYERLLAYNLRTYKIEPEIAQKWEQPSPSEYLFHLQPGVRFQNKPPVSGRALTTDDIIWSLERARTDDPKFYSRTLLSLVDKIEAPDKSTIRITTKGPDASTLVKLSVEELAMLAREVFQKNPKPTTADAAIGTGPFIMSSVEERVGAEYVRNPDYWKPGIPYLDGFRSRYFADPQGAWAAFVAGQVDIAGMPGPETKKYIADQGPGFTPNWYPADDATLLYPNVKVKPLDDARVTHALRLLIDHTEFKSAWSDVWVGRGRHGSIFPTAFSDLDLTEDEYAKYPEWKQPKDDAAKEALSLLSAAGFTRDNPLKFTLTSLSTNQVVAAGAQLLQAQWKRLSQGAVDVQLRLVDQPTIDATRAARTFNYAFLGHSAGMVDADIWLSTTYRTGGSLNFGEFSDPTLDAMIDKQRTQFDEPQRKATVKQIIFYAIDHSPMAIAANQYQLSGVKPKVRGYSPERFLNGRQYQSVWFSS